MEMELKNLKENIDCRGSLVAIEGLTDVDFVIKRIFYIYGNEKSLSRAGHANMKCDQACVCIQGSCFVRLNNGQGEKEVRLNRPNQLLAMPKGVWVEIEEFSSDCVLMVLAGGPYHADDYINDFNLFKELAK